MIVFCSCAQPLKNKHLSLRRGTYCFLRASLPSAHQKVIILYLKSRGKFAEIEKTQISKETISGGPSLKYKNQHRHISASYKWVLCPPIRMDVCQERPRSLHWNKPGDRLHIWKDELARSHLRLFLILKWICIQIITCEMIESERGS